MHDAGVNSGADTPTDRAGLPPASHRLDRDVSRVVQAVVPAGAPTSFWVGSRAGVARVLRRSAMPFGWAIALLVCAGSAFAVRDVLFPSLGVSAARSVWEPRPATGSTAPIIRSTTSADRHTAAAPAGVVVEPTTESTAPEGSTGSSVAAGGRVERVVGNGRGGDDSGTTSGGSGADDGTTSNGSVPSPGTTAASGHDGDDSTVTSTPGGPGVTTTTDAKVTTTTDGGVTTTTDATTGDTIADQSGRRGSGSGGGGGSDDSTP